MELTDEMIAQLKTVASPAQFVELAQQNGLELSAEDAQKLFDALHSDGPEGELDDSELDGVNGGFGLLGGLASLYPMLVNLSLRIFGRGTDKGGTLVGGAVTGRLVGMDTATDDNSFRV